MSNPFRAGDQAASQRLQTDYRLAGPDELKGGIQLILSTRNRLASQSQVLDFMHFAFQRHIDLNRLWVAMLGNRMLWAVLPVISPGKTSLLFCPTRLKDAEQAEAAAELVKIVCQDCQTRGIQLAQALIDPLEEGVQGLFFDLGFVRLAELVYMQTGLRRRGVYPMINGGMRLETYSAQTHAKFALAIGRSYMQSLDCPALNGVRDLEDIITGHKATGDFDPSWWFVLLEEDHPRGVLLLGRTSQSDLCELVYLGLTPEGRGRGMGDLLVKHALAAAIDMGCGQLSLAVDSINVPALKLYCRHGFQRVGSKIALLRNLHPDGEPETKPSTTDGSFTPHPHGR